MGRGCTKADCRRPEHAWRRKTPAMKNRPPMTGSNALTVAMMRRSFRMSRNFGPFRQSGSGIEPDAAEAREKAGIRFSQKAVVRSTRHWPDRPRASGSNAPEPTERPAHKLATVIRGHVYSRITVSVLFAELNAPTAAVPSLVAVRRILTWARGPERTGCGARSMALRNRRWSGALATR
jgi:hypothetical protein